VGYHDSHGHIVPQEVILSSIQAVVLGGSKRTQLLFMLLYRFSMALPTIEVTAAFDYFGLLKPECELKRILCRLHSKTLISQEIILLLTKYILNSSVSTLTTPF
jgi:hypothetical protein